MEEHIETQTVAADPPCIDAPGPQIALVLQGGGALGAYQAGVYQGLTEGGIEPDWVIGTSIGAINAAIIAGNAPSDRLPRLREFWGRMGNRRGFDAAWSPAFFGNVFRNINLMANGIPGFFRPNYPVALNVQAPVGIGRAAFYATDPLRKTLNELVDWDRVNGMPPRLTVGAVSARTGEMRYFDSRGMPLSVDHVMASGALPPAFPAIEIDGEPYWDGGIYSNTPVEVVLDDRPRRDSLIFCVNVWQPSGDDPANILQVMARQKDIQYASRSTSHVARQDQIHRLRHIVRELALRLPPEQRDDPAVQELAAYGCRTTMHLVQFLAPRLDGEDHSKDIDFASSSIRTRWEAGYAHARRMIEERPWDITADPMQGILVHNCAG